jgi:hypothetical protein
MQDHFRCDVEAVVVLLFEVRRNYTTLQSRSSYGASHRRFQVLCSVQVAGILKGSCKSHTFQDLSL